ncbi:MAG: GNAT family N-acetyltransferase [Simkaniaceae bacterium]|nr:GNAT family N-acetyltransferase [Simkaniaceae bacterium]MCF7852678.1 GNAT family N-acetyltransferase [Simkaniaceae bacterium]
MASISTYPIDRTEPTFIVVDKSSSSFPVVRTLFESTIAPLYGDQKKALNQIGEGADRLCEMMFVNGREMGLIVYKKTPREGHLELKTLCLINPSEHSGRGLGSVLLQRIETIARNRLAEYIDVSLSSEKPESLSFFRKRGFSVTRSVRDYYKPGATEFFLEKRIGSSDPSASLAKHPRYSGVPYQRPQPTLATASQSFAASGRSLETRATDSRTYSPIRARPMPMPERVRTVTIKMPYLRMIISGAKTYEGRINNGMFRYIRPGDIVSWEAGPHSVQTRILERKEFKSFEEMVDGIGFKALIPDAQNPSAAARIYHSIPTYTERSASFGVVAFKVAVLSHNTNTTLSEKRARE